MEFNPKFRVGDVVRVIDPHRNLLKDRVATVIWSGLDGTRDAVGIDKTEGEWNASRFELVSRAAHVLERPPLGLTPRYIRDAQRIVEIIEACQRYAQASKEIPKLWLDELEELNKRTAV